MLLVLFISNYKGVYIHTSQDFIKQWAKMDLHFIDHKINHYIHDITVNHVFTVTFPNRANKIIEIDESVFTKGKRVVYSSRTMAFQEFMP